MNSIFYDLETSGLNFVNQILTGYFALVDSEWNIVDDFDVKIRISRTQLPEPSAILVNRIDVLQHQKETSVREVDAIYQISEFLGENMPCNLIGYNNWKFDWPFLRTSILRNGLNPYFYGKLGHKDILSVVHKLYCVNQEFRTGLRAAMEGSDHMFRFEDVYKFATGSDYIQDHTAKGDVQHEIKLAKCLQQKWSIDVREFAAYEPTVTYREIGNYKVTKRFYINPETKQVEPRNMILLDDDTKNQAIWLDAKEWEKTKDVEKSTRYFNKKTSSFFIAGPGKEVDPRKCRELFGDMNLKSFFKPKDVDIEQQIVIIGFNAIDILHEAIWNCDTTRLDAINDSLLTDLYHRNLIANSCDPAYDNFFLDYVQCRYNGGMLLEKFDKDTGEIVVTTHPTYDDLVSEIKKLTGECDENVTLLNNLYNFYQDSDVNRALNG